MKVLVVEDNDNRIKKFNSYLPSTTVYVKTAEAACKQLDTDAFDLIFLDHDLGENQECVEPPDRNSGTTVVDYMVKHSGRIVTNTSPIVIVHSMNTYRASIMFHDLLSHGYDAYLEPFGSINLRLIANAAQEHAKSRTS